MVEFITACECTLRINEVATAVDYEEDLASRFFITIGEEGGDEESLNWSSQMSGGNRSTDLLTLMNMQTGTDRCKSGRSSNQQPRATLHPPRAVGALDPGSFLARLAALTPSDREVTSADQITVSSGGPLGRPKSEGLRSLDGMISEPGTKAFGIRHENGMMLTAESLNLFCEEQGDSAVRAVERFASAITAGGFRHQCSCLPHIERCVDAVRGSTMD